jgi:ABC-type phosphate transport system substrate-binding protein
MKQLTCLLLITGLLCSYSFGRNVPPPVSDIAVVVSHDVPVDDLTFTELRKIALGDRQFWSSNLRVTLLIRAPASRERDVILKDVLQMSEAQFHMYWIGKVFRAETTAGPKMVYSNEMALSLINSIPGSVAFMDVAQVPKDSKVIRVGGLLPGEKGYPLN